jgi:hypothetical protein
MADDGEKGKSGNQRKPWPTDPASYRIGVQIGEGAFAKVFRATCLEAPEGMNPEVAIKVIDLEHVTSSMEDIRVSSCCMDL